MKEKLIIKNFGPIKSVELELGRFNVLIGDQGTGKSTVAKLLEVLNRFLTELFITKNVEARNFLTIASLKGRLRVHSIEHYLKDDSTIKYLINDITVFELKDHRISPDFFESDYTTTLMYHWDFKLWQYIPADRGASSLFHAATWTDLLVANAGRIDIPTYFLEFYSLQDRAKRAKIEYDFSGILGVKYQYADGKEYIFKDSEKYKLIETSSAIQTNISLLSVVDWQFSEAFEHGSKIIIEEPELNLFPETQKRLMEFLVDKLVLNNSLFLTTHSPYILTSLNNMMYAWQLGQAKDAGEVSKVIEKSYWLNPAEVSAYRMMEDGTCRNILDVEEGLINAAEIDGVSNLLNKQFDALINLEVSSK